MRLEVDIDTSTNDTTRSSNCRYFSLCPRVIRIHDVACEFPLGRSSSPKVVRRAVSQHGEGENKVGMMKRWLFTTLGRSGESSTTSVENSGESSAGQDIAVFRKEDESGKPSRRGSPRGRRNRDPDIVPFGSGDFFAPSPLGMRMQQTLDKLNRLFENFVPASRDDFAAELSPNYWLREDDDAYSVRFEMPGLSKDDVKVTVEDGYLVVRGERKEERDDRDSWSRYYGSYASSFLLPENVKVDEVKAEMKHGELEIVVPKVDEEARNVKHIQVM